MPPQTPSAIKTLYLSLVLTIVLAAILMAGTIWIGSRAETENGWVRHTLAVRFQLANVLMLTQRAESSQRGFLLTGHGIYEDAYTASTAALPASLNELAKLIVDNPRQVDDVGKLKARIAEKLREMGDTIAQRKADGKAYTLADASIGEGRALMADIRSLVSGMQTEEDRLLTERQSRARTLGLLLDWGAGLTFVLICAIGTLVGYFTRRSFTEMATARDQLAYKNQELVEQITRREEAESQLRQSQKMEAVGQLTGGIAHDFNNMLGVIAGSLDLMQRRLDKSDFRIERFIDAAKKASERAAALTHRLLAFARRQPLEPKPVDLNRMIAGMSDLLRSTLGEQIRIEAVSAAGLWMTNVDAHQLESALLNIAINGRDAMPDGGKLTIETANSYLDDAYAKRHAEVAPGQYAMVAITDTGAGMPPEVARRAFDPFFTTKPTGKGTGLGLSQVYGFVKQSHGHIKIYSEIGAGTTIKLYLPRLAGPVETIERPAAQPVVAGKREDVILVVEDDPSMRQLTVDSLSELGYSVLDSDGAVNALAILDKRPDVKLLFTDVVMPEVNGKKLADEALKRRPDLKVIFTTGYTQNAVVHGGVLDAGVNFISKPFALDQLAAKVRAVLDGRASERG